MLKFIKKENPGQKDWGKPKIWLKAYIYGTYNGTK